MRLIRASDQTEVTLGAPLGRGGEGVVHTVAGAPKLVAKVYHKPPSAQKVDKLRAMIQRQSPPLLRVAAWPMDLLLDSQRAVRGLLMPKIGARQDTHKLYSPKSRRRSFPNTDFRFLVRAAANVARAFAQLHSEGHVIGDVNHGNALVGKDGTAVLIDCDSFQVKDHGRTYTCDVGSPLFTPPELQGRNFRGLKRESTHDDFGLAVVLFHLLFQGRHPYAGRFAGGDMPVERAIAESRFAYGAQATEKGMTAPPASLPLESFGPEIAALFERAFGSDAAARPAAAEWIEPLQRLEARLVACGARSGHYHPGGGACCWCSLERTSGVRLFGDDRMGPSAEALSAQQLWKAIESVPAPPMKVDMPREVVLAQSAGKSGEALGGLARIARNGAPFLAMALVIAVQGGFIRLDDLVPLVVPMLVVGCIFFGSKARKIVRLQSEWRKALARWRNDTAATVYFRVRAQLEETRRALERLERRRISEIEAAKRVVQSQQLAQYLDAIPVSQAVWSAVRQEHIAKLESRGIRSAGDVIRFSMRIFNYVPHEAVRELQAWAKRCEAQFRFDADQESWRKLVNAVDERYRVRLNSAVEDLKRGPELLMAKRRELENQRAAAEDRLVEAHKAIERRRRALRE